QPAELVRALEIGVRGDLAGHPQILGRARPPVRRELRGVELTRELDLLGCVARNLVDIRNRTTGPEGDEQTQHEPPAAHGRYHIATAHRARTRRPSRPSSIAT